MAGAGFQVESKGAEKLLAALNRVARFSDNTDDILEAIGSTHEKQVRRRIQDEKTDPHGEVWPEWSEEYAETRHEGHSLLQNEGHMLDSINYLVEPGGVRIGSNMIYAASHQYGDQKRGIPRREFIGLSDKNRAELLSDVLNSAIEDMLG